MYPNSKYIKPRLNPSLSFFPTEHLLQKNTTKFGICSKEELLRQVPFISGHSCIYDPSTEQIEEIELLDSNINNLFKARYIIEQKCYNIVTKPQ
jgi:hypothetical protein